VLLSRTKAAYAASSSAPDADLRDVRPQLPRARQGRFEQRCVTQTRRTAMQREETVVDRQGVAFIDPDRVVPGHFARTWSVLRLREAMSSTLAILAILASKLGS
jgi:hypothetical protein